MEPVRRHRCAARTTAAIVAGYGLGTFPTAYLAGRLARRGAPVDLRSSGSGNPGGLNVAKTLGSRWGAAVTAIDVAKGAAAAEVGRAVAGAAGANLGAAASVVGHCFPVWSRGRGGKGVGTSGGQVLATFPAFFPVDVAVAAAVVKLWPGRYRTIASMVASSSTWVVASVLAWRRAWPTGRGRATASLPVSAAVGAGVVVGRMLAGARRAGAVAAP